MYLRLVCSQKDLFKIDEAPFSIRPYPIVLALDKTRFRVGNYLRNLLTD